MIEGFEGAVPIFPLPNTVLFPGILLPLHIFEPRYREMVGDALTGNRLIAMALLRPGWENDYYGRPEVYSTICIGRIVNEQRLPDGRYNLMLYGLKRARIVEELKTSKLYRVVAAELAEETGAELRVSDLEGPQQNFLRAAAGALPGLNVDGSASVGTLVDVIGACLIQDVSVKQQILEELDVRARLERLIKVLQASTRRARGWPKPSIN